MQRKDCLDCQRLFSLWLPLDIPSVVAHCHEIFNRQDCRGEHTTEAYHLRYVS